MSEGGWRTDASGAACRYFAWARVVIRVAGFASTPLSGTLPLPQPDLPRAAAGTHCSDKVPAGKTVERELPCQRPREPRREAQGQ
eukprot:15468584-Alexandrium_andersonii.AAC.1